MCRLILTPLSASLIALALLLGGCEKKQEVEQRQIGYQDTGDWLDGCIIDSVDTSTYYIQYFYHKPPCPPCPDTVYQMPKGRWVWAWSTFRHYGTDTVYAFAWDGENPDSVFIPEGP